MTSPEPSTHAPTVPPDTRMRRFRGKLFVANDGDAVELNEVGEFIFTRIDGTRTIAQIADLVATEYDIEAHEAIADICDFLAELATIGAVKTS